MDRPDRRRFEADLKAAQGFRDLDELMERAARNHDALTDGIAAAAREAGVSQKVAPLKLRARVEEKVRGKYAGDLNRITDVARGGVEAPTPEAAAAFVRILSRRFRIVDEGWSVTDEGYFDGKLAVVFDDGQLGEVQIWPPGMLEAKGERGGHDLYKVSRDETQPPDARAQAVAKMQDLYADVRAALDPSWRAALEGDDMSGISAPNARRVSANSSSSTSGERSSPSTSAGSMAPQEPPSPDSRNMEPGSGSTAGMDPSTIKYRMGGASVSDVSADGAGVNGDAMIPMASSIEEYGDLADLDLSQMREDLGELLDIEVTGQDGGVWTPGQVLDDLEGDLQAQRVVDACMLGRS
jgi:hypothetical protein